jgi:hypothetical protein
VGRCSREPRGGRGQCDTPNGGPAPCEPTNGGPRASRRTEGPARADERRAPRGTAGLAGPGLPVWHGDFTTAGGRRVTERILAAGPVPRALWPSLTTVVQPMAALGDTAVTMLRDRIDGAELPQRTVELPVRLELRGSCGCAE